MTRTFALVVPTVFFTLSLLVPAVRHKSEVIYGYELFFTGLIGTLISVVGLWFKEIWQLLSWFGNVFFLAALGFEIYKLFKIAISLSVIALLLKFQYLINPTSMFNGHELEIFSVEVQEGYFFWVLASFSLLAISFCNYFVSNKKI